MTVTILDSTQDKQPSMGHKELLVELEGDQ